MCTVDSRVWNLPNRHKSLLKLCVDDKPWINDKNCFVVDVRDPDESGMTPVDSMPRRITVPAYVKQNCKDMTLNIVVDFTQFILSLSEKSDVGIHIDRYNGSVLIIIY